MEMAPYGGRAGEVEGFAGFKVRLEFRSLAYTSETSILVVERLAQSLWGGWRGQMVS